MNELTSATYTAEDFRRDLAVLVARLLDEHGVRKVVLIQVLPRYDSALKSACNGFNSKLDAANLLAIDLTRADERIVWWEMKRMRNQRFFLPDGVHLNDFGMKQYFKCMREAILSALRSLS